MKKESESEMDSESCAFTRSDEIFRMNPVMRHIVLILERASLQDIICTLREGLE
jgi:hypothetical protein